MEKIYIFSGLGVDKRVFDRIDFGNLNIEFIDWIEPQNKESFQSYAQRISLKITTENPTIIGLSFGGMLAVEISKIKKVKQLILIASAKNRKELPKIYRVLGKLKLNYLIPFNKFKKQNKVTNWFFGVESDEEKAMLKSILQDTDPKFLKWAIHQIVNWDNKISPENCIHIHGNKDRIIPIKNMKPDYIIENGGHFMTINRSKEIEKIINKISQKKQIHNESVILY